MKFRQHLLLAVLLILLSGLQVTLAKPLSCGWVIGQNTPWQPISINNRISQTFAGHNGARTSLFCSLPSLLSDSSSGRAAQTNKRHGKSLVSEAIVADFVVPPPQFIYWNRIYFVFLSGGCSHLYSSHTHLRGPPFCS
jgi:hypothetical protein